MPLGSVGVNHEGSSDSRWPRTMRFDEVSRSACCRSGDRSSRRPGHQCTSTCRAPPKADRHQRPNRGALTHPGFAPGHEPGSDAPATTVSTTSFTVASCACRTSLVLDQRGSTLEHPHRDRAALTRPTRSAAARYGAQRGGQPARTPAVDRTADRKVGPMGRGFHQQTGRRLEHVRSWLRRRVRYRSVPGSGPSLVRLQMSLCRRGIQQHLDQCHSATPSTTRDGSW